MNLDQVRDALIAALPAQLLVTGPAGAALDWLLLEAVPKLLGEVARLRAHQNAVASILGVNLAGAAEDERAALIEDAARLHDVIPAGAVWYYRTADGLEEVDGSAKAEEEAESILTDCRREALEDGEWGDFVESIEVGYLVKVLRITEQVSEGRKAHESDHLDYELTAIPAKGGT